MSPNTGHSGATLLAALLIFATGCIKDPESFQYPEVDTGPNDVVDVADGDVDDGDVGDVIENPDAPHDTDEDITEPSICTSDCSIGMPCQEDEACTSGICRQDQCSFAENCLEILQRGLADESGVYPLQTTSGVPYEAYCEMEAYGGGWTLALKVDGTSETFSYHSDLWTTDELYSPGAADLDKTQAKLPSFNDLPFSQLLVGLNPATSGDETAATRWLPVAVAASSLLDVFASGEYLPTHEGRASWKGLVPNSALQCNCDMEGLNVATSPDHGMVRIGIVANDQQDCSSPDSRLGIGGAGQACDQSAISAGLTTRCNLFGNYDPEFLAGDTEGCNPNAGDRETPAFGTVMVRHIPPRPSCQAHLDAGITRSGVYPINPGDDLPFNAYCDMDTADGGWTLAAIYGHQERPHRIRGNAYPRPGASFYGDGVRLIHDLNATRDKGRLVGNHSIDAASLFDVSNREFLAYLGHTVSDYITGQLPEGCNFFDGSTICDQNVYTGITIHRSNGEVLTDNAQACTTAAGWATDPFDEFGLHLIDGTSAVIQYHCHQSADSTLGIQNIGRIFTSFEASNGGFWNSGIHSHWGEGNIGDQDHYNLPGLLMIR